MFYRETRIEIVTTGWPQVARKQVLFDFDGTLSLVREGWPELMTTMMVNALAATPRAESRAALTSMIAEFAMKMNGRQTIEQMTYLADEVRARGGNPPDPEQYKSDFLELLNGRVAGRLQQLQAGTLPADDLIVPSARAFLTQLQQAGCGLRLASGTDLIHVRVELAALGLSGFFAPHIYGALPDPEAFSKRQVIAEMVQEYGLQPGELLGFGDGPIEIREVKRVGGIAVGVASDERLRQGISAEKRAILIDAGADIIIPDYREQDALLELLGVG